MEHIVERMDTFWDRICGTLNQGIPINPGETTTMTFFLLQQQQNVQRSTKYHPAITKGIARRHPPVDSALFLAQLSRLLPEKIIPGGGNNTLSDVMRFMSCLQGPDRNDTDRAFACGWIEFGPDGDLNNAPTIHGYGRCSRTSGTQSIRGP